MSKHIPYLSFEGMHDPIIDELKAVANEVIVSNWYILGNKVKQFEDEFASFTDVEYAVGVNSGLDGLIIALRCLEIGPEDEVIVASNAYIACWNAIHAVGATIVPVEPDPNTHCIDAKTISQQISSKTKAIMAVHLFGQMCDMERIMEIANQHDLFVIEDNAQSQGAKIGQRHSASFGHISSTSFYPGKNLGALGDAGIITTNDEALAQKARSLRNYGSQVKYKNDYIGVNSRLDELQAAFLSVKLKYIDQWNRERRQIAEAYNEQLEYEWVKISEDNVCHIYCIQSKERDQLQEYLKQKGIHTMIHYPIPPHLQEAYKFLGFQVGDFVIAEKLAKQSLSLPIYPGLDIGAVSYICSAIRDSGIPLLLV